MPKIERKPYHVSTHIGAIVHDVARLRRTEVDKALKPLRITRAQRWVLIYLSQLDQKGISQKELAEAMNVGQVAIGERIVLLEAAGCIERTADPRDRRQRLIVLSDYGYAILERSREISNQINRTILKRISPDELATAERVLNIMRENLLRLGQEAGATDPD